MMFDSGAPETLCGVGSMLRHTESVRAWLPGALRALGVQTLLDAPCGDRHWISRVSLPCAYVGVDHDLRMVTKAREGGADVRVADIRYDDLPKADAILSRDFLQHLSMEDMELALENMKSSGAAYLIATCHGADGPDIKTGGFRQTDLRARFGTPLDKVSDGKHGRILGVWGL